MFDFQKFPRLDCRNDKAMKAAENAIVRAYSAKAARELAHVYHCALVEHAIAHNSADRLSNYFNRLPENAPKRALRMWVEKYTTMTFGHDKAGNARFLGADKVYNWESGKEGETIPFYAMPEVKKDNNAKTFNLDAMLVLALDRARAKAKEGKLSANDNALAEGLGKLLAKHHNTMAANAPVKEQGNVVDATFTVVEPGTAVTIAAAA